MAISIIQDKIGNVLIFYLKDGISYLLKQGHESLHNTSILFLEKSAPVHWHKKNEYLCAVFLCLLLSEDLRQNDLCVFITANVNKGKSEIHFPKLINLN